MTTDVAGSINGYYKQIYLAIKELLKLKDDNSSVGIECGADIRVFNANNMNESIEVKFYKKNIGLYSPEISKTIYNFYTQTVDDRRLYFNTNTKVPSTDIFKEDGEIFYLNKEEGISYILHLLIKYETNKSKANTIREYFIKVGIVCDKCAKNACDICISKFIEQFKNQYPMHFDKIIKINPTVQLNQFVEKIGFIFEDRPKDQSIAILKKELKTLLRENYKDLVSDFDDLILEAIIHKIAMSFFDSTVVNSLIKNPSIDYQTHKKVDKSNVKHFISTYQTFLNEYKEDVLELKIFDIVERSNLDEQKIIFKFNQEFEEYLCSERSLEVYNVATIKQYFRDIEMKFKSEDERNDLAIRFDLYHKGFGLLSYLMSLKVREVSLREDIVFLRGIDEESLSIKNYDYYDYRKISTFIDANKQSEDAYYRYMELEECSCSLLECISEYCTTPYIKINKLEMKMSIEEYQIINNIPLEVIEEIKELVSSNKNLLIISPAPLYKNHFFNAMISSIPKRCSFFTIGEDLLSLPAICLGKPHATVDSLKSDYDENIKKIAVAASVYDKCISLIENYSLSDNFSFSDSAAFNNFKLLLDKNNCLIGTLKRIVSDFRKMSTFEEVCKDLSILNDVDFNIFDSFILLDNYYVNGKRQDVINIFNKTL
ncbi:hypothetical protein ACZ11_06650 [Lysinibacillus xylanilyticus]|uniref:Uncharacterized protein n=1 Tax=Lysinibacillus xylanilyticus TaxID=582475 RepID=A0A0K9FB92_9BACI|nr:hypothetical protein [Lysinibacillus xylanilyticus]KMY31864.1 hypothetical protein ACZ11_06650 [Lysinibacillus xylanilyticus]